MLNSRVVGGETRGRARCGNRRVWHRCIQTGRVSRPADGPAAVHGEHISQLRVERVRSHARSPIIVHRSSFTNHRSLVGGPQLGRARHVGSALAATRATPSRRWRSAMRACLTLLCYPTCCIIPRSPSPARTLSSHLVRSICALRKRDGLSTALLTFTARMHSRELETCFLDVCEAAGLSCTGPFLHWPPVPSLGTGSELSVLWKSQ